MAKMLDALARAQEERRRKEEQAAAGQPAESVAPPTAQRPLPDLPDNKRDEPRSADRNGASPAPPVNFHSHVDGVVIGAHDDQSPITEQIRHIRTNLESVLADYPSRMIVITSPVSGDGKSLVTANLAWVLADSPDSRVALIDADMRKPDQHRIFGMKATPGLAEVLAEKADLDQALRPCGRSNFFVLPAGRAVPNPTVLLTANRISRLHEQLESQFDWIIFDTPPLLPVTDASLLARESQGMILVVRMGQTHRKQILKAQNLMAEMRLPVLGSVLNEFKAHDKRDNYYYRYYSRVSAGGRP